MVEESPSVKERVQISDEEENSQKNHFAVARILTHDLCLLSQVLYPLEHGDLP